MVETADLKLLARRVLERDTARDTRRDGCLAAASKQREPARQGLATASEPGALVRASYDRCLAALQERCPDLVDESCWERTLEDGRQFLAQWADRARALGWTAHDLFGLPPLPEKPAPNYRRLSRYDGTGLAWQLRGRAVVALTEATAAIENPTGAITIYRKNNKPALGPIGDTLDDFR